MGDHFSVQTAEFTRARFRRCHWHKVFAILASVVVFCTTYALILPAITKEQPVYCGYTDEHTDDCYEEIRALTCGLAESTVHEHTDECSTIEKRLTCDHKIHEHTQQCYSDPEADVEPREHWEPTVERVELTDDWNADVLAIAKTQLGYHESERNYIVCHADAPVYVTRYALTTANDNVSQKRIQKNGWRLYGNNNSNDLTDLSFWTLIDTVADGQTGMDPAADYARYEFTIDSPGTYRYFALDITPTRTSNYQQSFFQFSEWDMIAPTVGTPADGTTYYRKPVYSFDDLLGQYVVACLAVNDKRNATSTARRPSPPASCRM